jgi:hypothetical protein
VGALLVIGALAKRGRLGAVPATLLVVVWWVGIAFGESYVVASKGEALARGWLPAILMPLGALALAAPVLLRGVSVRAAAMALDARAGLGERLATAAELAESARAATPAARCVAAQAVAAANDADAARFPLWRRTRATAGALGLVVVLCAALALVPAPAAPGDGAAPPGAAATGDDDGRKLVLAAPPENLDPRRAIRLADLAAGERARYIDALRRAAEGENDPRKAQALRDVADAIEAADADAIRRALDALTRARGLLPEELAAELAAPGGGKADGAAGQVSVYSEQYAEALAAKNGGAPAAGGRDGAREFVARDDAWAEARRRAAEALRGGSPVPAKYRPVLRRFFLPGR